MAILNLKNFCIFLSFILFFKIDCSPSLVWKGKKGKKEVLIIGDVHFYLMKEDKYKSKIIFDKEVFSPILEHFIEALSLKKSKTNFLLESHADNDLDNNLKL